MAHKIRPVKIESPRRHQYDGSVQFDGSITWDNIHLVYDVNILQNKVIEPNVIPSASVVYNVRLIRHHPVQKIDSQAQVYSPFVFKGIKVFVDLIPSQATVYSPSFSFDLLPILIAQYNQELYDKLKLMKDDAYAAHGETTMEPYFKDLFDAMVAYIRSDEHTDILIDVIQTVYSYYTMGYVYDTDDILMDDAAAIDVFDMGGVAPDILDYPVDYYSQSGGTNITDDTNTILNAETGDASDIKNNLLDPMRQTITDKIDEVLNPSIETTQLELLDKQQNYDKVMDQLGYESFLNAREQDFSELDFLF